MKNCMSKLISNGLVPSFLVSIFPRYKQENWGADDAKSHSSTAASMLLPSTAPTKKSGLQDPVSRGCREGRTWRALTCSTRSLSRWSTLFLMAHLQQEVTVLLKEEMWRHHELQLPSSRHSTSWTDGVLSTWTPSCPLSLSQLPSLPHKLYKRRGAQCVLAVTDLTQLGGSGTAAQLSVRRCWFTVAACLPGSSPPGSRTLIFPG